MSEVLWFFSVVQASLSHKGTSCNTLLEPKKDGTNIENMREVYAAMVS